MAGRGFWFGVGGLVCAIIALVLFWVPVAGVIVAVIATALSVTALVLGVRDRSGSGIALGVIVTLASLIALLLGIAFTGIFGEGVTPTSDEVTEQAAAFG
ncbi:hypothetical protein [Demequina mangrovi]|uniref:DUF4190 domain-containing protein n=1 Tax=Demequina mangrovi TaxID=1043493 RepID=A0A1H7A605_9MICO|nr:hypothetical protein [Demequina mangrovi]SEJ57432.1 hypothetical protein SAMN05421637_2256 [Demequina mangrovi]